MKNFYRKLSFRKSKALYVFLMACIVGLAPSVEAKNTKVEPPPWSEMEQTEKVKYEKEFKCAEATTVMRLVVQWPVTETTTLDTNGMYKQIYTLDDSTRAVVGYKMVKQPAKDIPVIALITVGEVSIIAAEFHYVKYVQAAMSAGTRPEDVVMKDAIKNSTGKYFCYAN